MKPVFAAALLLSSAAAAQTVQPPVRWEDTPDVRLNVPAEAGAAARPPAGVTWRAPARTEPAPRAAAASRPAPARAEPVRAPVRVAERSAPRPSLAYRDDAYDPRRAGYDRDRYDDVIYNRDERDWPPEDDFYEPEPMPYNYRGTEWDQRWDDGEWEPAYREPYYPPAPPLPYHYGPGTWGGYAGPVVVTETIVTSSPTVVQTHSYERVGTGKRVQRKYRTKPRSCDCAPPYRGGEKG